MRVTVAPPEDRGALSEPVRIDVLRRIPDLSVPLSAERVSLTLEDGIDELGTLELPAVDGLIPRYVLLDAICADFAWLILERFFERTIYPSLDLVWESKGLRISRGPITLAEDVTLVEDSLVRLLHNRVGWALFLQEVWGKPEQSEEWFYDPEGADGAGAPRAISDGRTVVDVSEPLPELSSNQDPLNVLFTVGGVALGVVPVACRAGTVGAHRLRTALVEAAGFELCRAAVREGLLERPYDAPGSLFERLAEAGRRSTLEGGAPPPLSDEAQAQFAPGWPGAVARALAPSGEGTVIPRRGGGGIDTSASRRVAFPSAALADVIAACEAMQETVVPIGPAGREPGRLSYAPDLILLAGGDPSARAPGSRPVPESAMGRPRVFGRHAFEELYVALPDPWQHGTPYEQIKFKQSLELLRGRRFHSALEIGCAEGGFSAKLAPQVDRLVAADISRVALERAAQRCAQFGNIEYRLLDVFSDGIDGGYDLIVCSEVLYFLEDLEALGPVAARIEAALQPGGMLLMANANLQVDDPNGGGYDWDHPFGAGTIGDTFEDFPELYLAREVRTPLYRVQLFQKLGALRPHGGEGKAEVTVLSKQPAPPPREAEDRLIFAGGAAPEADADAEAGTDRLPILMYHRIAPEGSEALAQYRVTPERFEEQLSYLRDSGYYSVDIETWHAAMTAHRPLPGRAVLLTFDDGYFDFLDYAWPLLESYGFSATVFLVAGEVGGTNRWDQRFGEELELMGWNEVRELNANGASFGSHSTTHPNLTQISPAEVVSEAIRSRAILERELGTSVRSLSYPHGGEDQVVRHLVGGCGYLYGFSVRPGRAGFWDPPLALPRLEVSGTASFEDFVRLLT